MNKVFKALSDPTRRKILELLKEEDMSAGEIAENFNMSKPSISHHLNALKNSGLVLWEKDGQNIIYSLNTTIIQELMKWTFNFLRKGDNENEQ